MPQMMLKERRKVGRGIRALMCRTASEARLRQHTSVGKGACLMPPAHPNMSIPWGYSAAWVRAGRLPPQSSSAAMPGNTLPSSSSRDAPPPVETKWTLSSMFHLAAAVAESPPPMMPRPPFCVSSATASRSALVPLEKLSNSKTPAGPFQTTVLELMTVSRNSSMDLGPQSMPSQPSGMPSSLVTILISCSFLKSWPQAQSTGSTISTPLALAFSISLGASSAPFLSKSDLPISMPKQVFMKV
mmetsp:Transcript_73491/g.195363  ORF Transcript_73491/g.195363 Transcript_73491/m.195363 type:complete len:243 (-) Transcript_73491:351-1079(-)